MVKKPSLSVEVAKVMGARLRGLKGMPSIDLSERINQSSSIDLPNLRQLIKETQDYVRRERKKILQKDPYLAQEVKSYMFIQTT